MAKQIPVQSFTLLDKMWSMQENVLAVTGTLARL